MTTDWRLARTWTVAALTVPLSLFGARALAQGSAREALRAAREPLAVFDVDDARTTEALATLGRALEREPSGPDARELRFVRAVAAADMLLIARRRRDEDLRARIADAYGVPPADLVASIQADLSRLDFGVYRETAADASAAIGEPGSLELPPLDAAHTRRQAAFFSRVSEALISSERPTEVLAPLAEDPCGEAARPCPDPYRHYGPTGRRAIAAMTGVFQVVAALRRTAELGDPFSAALAREVLVDSVLLHFVPIAPPDWAPSVRPVEVEGAGREIAPDALVVLGPRTLRAGWAPRVSWDSEGRPTVRGEGSPLLADASSAAFRIPRNLPAGVRPVEGLADYLASTLRGAERVALVVEPSVESSLLSRVLRTAEVSGLPIVSLAGVGADGVPRGIPLRVLHEDSPAPPNPVGVFVRLGGFSVRRPGGMSLTLPRLRGEDGWHFDMEGLERATVRRADRPVVLRYMATTEAALVLRAALVIAPPDRPVELLVP